MINNNNNFTVNIEQLKNEQIDGISIVYVNGYLDAHTAPILEEKLEELTKSGFFKILVNFSELSYISSAGLGVFMGFIEECREQGGDIKMCQMQENVYTIFDLLGFPLLFDIGKDQQSMILKFEE